MIFISPNSSEIVIRNFFLKKANQETRPVLAVLTLRTTKCASRNFVLFQMCNWKCYHTHNFEIDVLFFFGGVGVGGGANLKSQCKEFLTKVTMC